MRPTNRSSCAGAAAASGSRCASFDTAPTARISPVSGSYSSCGGDAFAGGFHGSAGARFGAGERLLPFVGLTERGGGAGGGGGGGFGAPCGSAGRPVGA